MFGRLPAFGLYARHVDGLRVQRASFFASQPDGRSVVFCDDVRRLELASVSCSGQADGGTDVVLNNVKDAFVHGFAGSTKASSIMKVYLARSRATSSSRPTLCGPE